MTTIVRASTLSAYADCPRRAVARMMRAEIEAAGHALRTLPQSIGAAVGTAVHAAAAVTLHERLRTGALPPAGDADEQAGAYACTVLVDPASLEEALEDRRIERETAEIEARMLRWRQAGL